MIQTKLTFRDVEFYVTRILEQLRADGFQPEAVLGISRGGLTPAVMISHSLGIPMIPFQWSTRDHANLAKDLMDVKTADYTRVIIVDEICDTGITFMHIQETVPERLVAKFASITLKSDSSFVPDFMGHTVDSKEWVVYPWEMEPLDVPDEEVL